MASKLPIIIEREYKTRVYKKSFILTTLLVPIFMVAAMMLPSVFMILGGEDKQVVAVIDHTKQYFDVLKSTDTYRFVPADKPLEEYKAEGEDADVSVILEIRQDLREDPKAITLFSFRTLPSGLENYINKCLSEHITRQKLLANRVDSIEQIISESHTDIVTPTYKLGEDGADIATSGKLSTVLGILSSLMIYLCITMYGAVVLQSVMEEKKNRIVEVIISSVRPFDLMMGKILGIISVAITQIAIWFVLLTLLLQVGLFALGEMASSTEIAVGSNSLSSADVLELKQILGGVNLLELALSFVLYFIGGFFLYASLYAALGSAVTSDEDAQMVMMPLSIFSVVAFYTGLACAESPDSMLATVASYIPFTSPIVMMIRIPYGVALWEELLSLALLYGGFVLMVYLSARIYRVGILLYGKKPSLVEIAKWMIRG